MEDWRNDPNKKTLIVIRRSGYGQKDNTSAVTQERENSRYGQDEGLDVVDTVSMIETAYRSKNRRKFREAISNARKKGVKHIVFYHSSRETRNLTDNEWSEDLCKQDKLIIHHVSNGRVYWKHTTDHEWQARDFDVVINKSDSRSKSTRVKDSYLTKAKDGWWPYRHTPLGYIHSKEIDQWGVPKKGTAKLVRDPNEKRVKQVQREFEFRAMGYSYDDIRTQIINEGFIPPEKVKKYNRSTIEKRLKNPLYWGYFYLHGSPVKYPGKHELIIPKKILKTVEAINSGNRGKIKKLPDQQGVFDDGWIRCAHPECQRQLTFDPKEKSIKSEGGQIKIYNYYRCTNSRQIHEKEVSIEEKKIFEQFEAAIAAISISDDFAKDIANALNETHAEAKKSIKREMQSYREAKEVLKLERKKAYQFLSKGTVTSEIYQEEISRIDKEDDELTDKLEQAQLQINDDYKVGVEKVFELAKDALALWKSVTREERIEKLKMICSNPTLDGRTVRYDLQKPFQILALMRGNSKWRRVRDSNPRSL